MKPNPKVTKRPYVRKKAEETNQPFVEVRFAEADDKAEPPSPPPKDGGASWTFDAITHRGVFVGGSMDGRRLESSAASVLISAGGDLVRPDRYSFFPLWGGVEGLWLVDGIVTFDAIKRVLDAYSRSVARVSALT